MKVLYGFLVSLGIVGCIAGVALSIMAMVSTIIGIWLAFSASIILGILSLCVAPANLVYGVCWWFGMNVPEAIQAWVNFPI